MYIDLLFGRIGGVGEQRPETGQHTYPTDRPNKSDTGTEGNREKNGFSVRLPNRGYTEIRSRNIDVGAENSSPNTYGAARQTAADLSARDIGRATCRERLCQYV